MSTIGGTTGVLEMVLIGPKSNVLLMGPTGTSRAYM